MPYDHRNEKKDMINEELCHPISLEDLDPDRIVTHRALGVSYCYLGHAECYDRHTSERLADEADWEAESQEES